MRGHEQKIETFIKGLEKDGPRDTQEFEKIEIPNPTVSKSISKSTNKFPTINTENGEKWLGKINKDVPNPTDKDFDRERHFNEHTKRTAMYSSWNKAGFGAHDGLLIDPNNPLYKGYAHYKENVDADKDLYDTIMKLTGGNGEHNKGGKK